MATKMTREEAINTVRNIYQTDNEKEALEILIPELAESEDERIRKALVWHLKADVDFVSNGVTKAECIAYLEKQKERKHTELTAEERMKNDKHFLSICQHLETLISESKNDEAKESIDKDYRWLCEFYRKSLSAPVEENYKEPAEWSEEDETYLQDALWCVKQAYKLCKTENDTGTCWSAEKWLKSLKPSWKPSEEQMKALYDACCIAFEEERDFHPSLSRLYHDLRKL